MEEIRFFDGAWVVWDVLAGAPRATQPDDVFAEALPIIVNADTPALTLNGGSGADVYRITSALSAHITIADSDRPLDEFERIEFTSGVPVSGVVMAGDLATGSLVITIDGQYELIVNNLQYVVFVDPAGREFTATDFAATYETGFPNVAIFEAISDDITIAAASVGTHAPVALSGFVTASDADGDTVSYRLSGASEALGFSINQLTGELFYVGDGGNLNLNQVSHEITVIAISAAFDTNSFEVEQRLTVHIIGAEAPLAIGFNAAGDQQLAVTDEGLEIGQLFGLNANSVDRFWSLVGGEDAGAFELSQNGLLKWVSAPDIGGSRSSDGDLFYRLRVQLTDGVSTVTQDLTIELTAEQTAPNPDGYEVDYRVDLYDGRVDLAPDTDLAIISSSPAQAVTWTITHGASDETGRLLFHLSHDGVSADGRIGLRSSVLGVVEKFDYETAPQFTITLTGQVEGGGTITATVVLNVRDVVELPSLYLEAIDTAVSGVKGCYRRSQ